MTCSLVGVLVVFAWVAKLRAGCSFSRGKVKDKRSQEERVNVSSLAAIKVTLSQVVASFWLGSAAASGAALVWIIVEFSSVPPAAAQAAVGYSFTQEAGCKILY